MSDVATIREPFIPLRQAAVTLGLPAAWLRRQAEAGAVPALIVGRRIFLNPVAVEQTLIEQSRRQKGVAHA